MGAYDDQELLGNAPNSAGTSAWPLHIGYSSLDAGLPSAVPVDWPMASHPPSPVPATGAQPPPRSTQQHVEPLQIDRRPVGDSLSGGPTSPLGAAAIEYTSLDEEGPDPPPEFVCPLTKSLMREPVTIPTGYSFERSAIEQWLASGRLVCPMSGVPLQAPVPLVPNTALRAAINSWAKNHAPWLVDPATDHIKPNDSLSSYHPDGDSSSSEPPSGRRDNLTPRLAAPAQTRAERGTGGVAFLLTMLLLAAYVSTFVLAVWKSDWNLFNVAFNPFIGANFNGLVSLGARGRALTVGRNEWWRVFSSSWVPPGVVALVSLLIAAGALVRLACAALPLPIVTVPAIVGLSTTVGALVSTNLNVRYITAGGFTPVIALLALAWIEHLVRGWAYYRRLLNFVFLFVITGALGVLSLLPTQDFWGAAGTFASAFCLGGSLTLLSSNMDHSRLFRAPLARAVVSAVLAGLFVAMAAVSSVGFAVRSNAGERCGAVCRVLSCTPTRHWKCLPVDAWGGQCGISLENPQDPTEGGVLLCPDGSQIAIAGSSGDLDKVTSKRVSKLCRSYCGTSDDSDDDDD